MSLRVAQRERGRKREKGYWRLKETDSSKLCRGYLHFNVRHTSATPAHGWLHRTTADSNARTFLSTSRQARSMNINLHLYFNALQHGEALLSGSISFLIFTPTPCASEIKGRWFESTSPKWDKPSAARYAVSSFRWLSRSRTPNILGTGAA